MYFANAKHYVLLKQHYVSAKADNMYFANAKHYVLLKQHYVSAKADIMYLATPNIVEFTLL